MDVNSPVVTVRAGTGVSELGNGLYYREEGVEAGVCYQSLYSDDGEDAYDLAKIRQMKRAEKERAKTLKKRNPKRNAQKTLSEAEVKPAPEVLDEPLGDQVDQSASVQKSGEAWASFRTKRLVTFAKNPPLPRPFKQHEETVIIAHFPTLPFYAIGGTPVQSRPARTSELCKIDQPVSGHPSVRVRMPTQTPTDVFSHVAANLPSRAPTSHKAATCRVSKVPPAQVATQLPTRLPTRIVGLPLHSLTHPRLNGPALRRGARYIPDLGDVSVVSDSPQSEPKRGHLTVSAETAACDDAREYDSEEINLLSETVCHHHTDEVCDHTHICRAAEIPFENTDAESSRQSEPDLKRLSPQVEVELEHQQLDTNQRRKLQDSSQAEQTQQCPQVCVEAGGTAEKPVQEAAEQTCNIKSVESDNFFAQATPTLMSTLDAKAEMNVPEASGVEATDEKPAPVSAPPKSAGLPAFQMKSPMIPHGKSLAGLDRLVMVSPSPTPLELLVSIEPEKIFAGELEDWPSPIVSSSSIIWPVSALLRVRTFVGCSSLPVRAAGLSHILSGGLTERPSLGIRSRFSLGGVFHDDLWDKSDMMSLQLKPPRPFFNKSEVSQKPTQTLAWRSVDKKPLAPLPEESLWAIKQRSDKDSG